jgi:hypothetical protein
MGCISLLLHIHKKDCQRDLLTISRFPLRWSDTWAPMPQYLMEEEAENGEHKRLEIFR